MHVTYYRQNNYLKQSKLNIRQNYRILMALSHTRNSHPSSKSIFAICLCLMRVKHENHENAGTVKEATNQHVLVCEFLFIINKYDVWKNIIFVGCNACKRRISKY